MDQRQQSNQPLPSRPSGQPADFEFSMQLGYPQNVCSAIEHCPVSALNPFPRFSGLAFRPRRMRERDRRGERSHHWTTPQEIRHRRAKVVNLGIGLLRESEDGRLPRHRKMDNVFGHAPQYAARTAQDRVRVFLTVSSSQACHVGF